MATEKFPNPTPIYRITHFKNLETILKRDGIYAPNMTPNDGLAHMAIHHLSIQNQRACTLVPCGPRGTVHDYVPFYFGPKAPMLYSIYRNNVQDYSGGQKPVVYLVTFAQFIQSNGLRFVFTDGHAIMAYTSFYDDLSQLKNIDWSIIKSKYWNDTQDYPDRCRRRNTEFLVHEKVPWNSIKAIIVMDNGIADEVNSILSEFNSGVPVKVKRDWYY
jgi:hypothetical protein